MELQINQLKCGLILSFRLNYVVNYLVFITFSLSLGGLNVQMMTEMNSSCKKGVAWKDNFGTKGDF